MSRSIIKIKIAIHKDIFFSKLYYLYLVISLQIGVVKKRTMQVVYIYILWDATVSLSIVIADDEIYIYIALRFTHKFQLNARNSFREPIDYHDNVTAELRCVYYSPETVQWKYTLHYDFYKLVKMWR